MPKKNLIVVPQTTEENLFWEQYGGLLFDDPEDPNNALIGVLRWVSLEYFSAMRNRKNFKFDVTVKLDCD